jgi:glutamate dehydrogenase/leucine dehydrogenase
MSIKCAVAGLPYGGEKAELSLIQEIIKGELERLSGVCRQDLYVIGEDVDVPALMSYDSELCLG